MAKKSQKNTKKQIVKKAKEVEIINQNNADKNVIADKKLAKLLGYDSKGEERNNRFTQILPKSLKEKIEAFSSKNKSKKLKITKTNSILSKFRLKFFDSNEKEVAKLKNFASEIEKLEKKIKKMSQDKLQSEVQKLKEEFQKKLTPDTKILMEKGRAWLDTKQGAEVLDFIMEKLPMCYALVREAANRTSNHRHFEVQLMAGIALSQGRIIEFKTGEGKHLLLRSHYFSTRFLDVVHILSL